MTPYQRGSKFENAVKKDLEAHGYVCCRSAGSHSSFDVMALRKDAKPLLVQCKTSGRIDPEDRHLLIDDAKLAGGLPILAEKEAKGQVAYWIVNFDRGRGARLAP